MAQRESPLEAVISDDIDNLSESNKSDSTVKANPQREPRYLYYRLYSEEIGIPSKQPAFPGSLYLGRVRANSIAPPQTVVLIKRRLCKIEDIRDDRSSSTLFLSGSSRSPMNDAERMSILTPGGSGSTPEEPIELVVKSSAYEINQRSVNKMSPDPQYIYYNLYTEDGEVQVKRPINPGAHNSPSVARIDNNLIPPPHTINSIIRCISYTEGFEYGFWHQLFVDIASESPINDNEFLILRSGGPGSTPERPLTFVRSSEMKKYIKAKYSMSGREGFLTTNRNEILSTDGVVRREASTPKGKVDHLHQSTPVTSVFNLPQYDCVYRARNTAGQHGFVMQDNATIC